MRWAYVYGVALLDLELILNAIIDLTGLGRFVSSLKKSEWITTLTIADDM